MPDFVVTQTFVNTANAAQLHDEARGALTDWPASFLQREDGQFVYRVDRAGVDEVAVQAAINNHVPNPNYGITTAITTMREYRAKTAPTTAETVAVLKILLDRLVPEVGGPKSPGNKAV